ncbi:polycomb complex protein BMI-1 [Caerostris darwini]|uniref:Polycomb complex protein BMI-1 n=1 Tax=Caerostris darwini TaxID=1538125 RepID=A0AAV4QC54_9ARAC|nr:polycomb complex protein BMI-1 [Caerostris darwini]
MQTSGNIQLKDLNKLLTCVLCKGYYIDATTIIECLHSFCRTCIVRYLQSNKFCPTCEVQVHKTRPLVNIRSDQTLQDIVYKVVPNLFKNEMKRRRDFYRQNDPIIQRSIPSSSEKRGDVWGCDRLIFTPEDMISVSLEYFPLKMHASDSSSNLFSIGDKSRVRSDRRYFRCPGASKVHHLKKLLQGKCGLLNSKKKVDILYRHDVLKDEYTLVDLAYIYAWKRSEPLRLFFKIGEVTNVDITKEGAKTASENTVTPESLVASVMPTTSRCSILPDASPAPVAAAPSSRHPSPPPSPQTAQEPNYFQVATQNVANMPREQHAGVPAIKLKSALKKPASNFHCSNASLYGDGLNNIDQELSDNRQCLKRRLSNVKMESDEFKTKKRVTFSVNLVQNSQNIENKDLKQKVSTFPNHRKLYRADPVNIPNINSFCSKRKTSLRKSS